MPEGSASDGLGFADPAEEGRLRAVLRYAAFGAGDVPELAGLVRLAAHICGSESAAVTLVDAEAVRELAVLSGEPRALPRASSPDPYLVTSEEAVAVADSLVDTRFAGAHLVADLGFRRYAAAPLLTSDEFVFGVLTASSTEPGPTSDKQLACLRDLAAQAVIVLENRLLASAVARLSTSDQLTGLFNQRGFSEALASAIQRAERGLGSPSVIVVDIDGFADLNDRHGHEAGDEILRTIAARLASTARNADTVARLKGDQFALLLEHTGGAGAAGALGRLRDGVRGVVSVGDKEVPVSASGGVATYRPGDTGSALVARADAAMYLDKSMVPNADVR